MEFDYDRPADLRDIYVWKCKRIQGRKHRRQCPSLSCPLDSLPPGGGGGGGGRLTAVDLPPGASCPGISCPPPWLSSPPGGKLSRPAYLTPPPLQQSKNIIYTCYFVISLYHFNEIRSSISHKWQIGACWVNIGKILTSSWIKISRLSDY